MEDPMVDSVANSGADRRSLKNFMVRPRQQLRYSLALVTGCCLSVILFLMIVVFQMKQTINTLSLAYRLDPEIVVSVQGALSSAVYVALLLAAGVIGLAFIVGIRLSHRIYGPLVSINRFIEELAGGNYKSRMTLRKDDDLIEIRDSLNNLAESLEKRHSR
jgi:methyl-accepting chemotaxis protein